jgi:predicted DNA-binding transcriptional regulator AlpA
MGKKNKLLTAVECCILLDLPIDKFLKLEKEQSLPPSIDVGIGRRWYKHEILEWYEDAKEHLD